MSVLMANLLIELWGYTNPINCVERMHHTRMEDIKELWLGLPDGERDPRLVFLLDNWPGAIEA